MIFEQYKEDAAPVKVIEVDNKTSYTLQVVTDENTTGELENLILFENPIDDKIGHIITYNTLATTSETENEIVEAGIKEATTITTTDTNKGVISMHLTYYCKAYGTSKDCGGTDAATGCYQYWEMTVSSGGGDGAAGHRPSACAVGRGLGPLGFGGCGALVAPCPRTAAPAPGDCPDDCCGHRPRPGHGRRVGHLATLRRRAFLLALLCVALLFPPPPPRRQP